MVYSQKACDSYKSQFYWILYIFFHVQDQLDDAQRPGEEKNEENRDCKEEEKGVNMTDDFDSHLQDVEKKGDSMLIRNNILIVHHWVMAG